MSMASFLGQKCLDECEVCGGRDYINAAVLQEAEENSLRSGSELANAPCPRRLEQERDDWRRVAEMLENYVLLYGQQGPVSIEALAEYERVKEKYMSGEKVS